MGVFATVFPVAAAKRSNHAKWVASGAMILLTAYDNETAKMT
jgi:hypothetical protein